MTNPNAPIILREDVAPLVKLVDHVDAESFTLAEAVASGSVTRPSAVERAEELSDILIEAEALLGEHGPDVLAKRAEQIATVSLDLQFVLSTEPSPATSLRLAHAIRHAKAKENKARMDAIDAIDARSRSLERSVKATHDPAIKAVFAVEARRKIDDLVGLGGAIEASHPPLYEELEASIAETLLRLEGVTGAPLGAKPNGEDDGPAADDEGGSHPSTSGGAPHRHGPHCQH